MFESLNGQVVVVVGASSGLGLATAAAALAAGADVTIVARDPGRLEVARNSIGGSVRAVALDAADAEAVAAMFEELDRVDHVVSFTGEQPSGQRARHDARAAAGRPRRTRVGGPQPVRGGRPRMPATGSFTFCSGVSAWRPRPGRAAGAAATAAVESYGRAMAVELAPIRVNTICPGAFDTPVLDRTFGDRKAEALQPYLSTLPAGRLGQPHELAHAALFLMTNAYVTGTVLHVDGGSLLI